MATLQEMKAILSSEFSISVEQLIEEHQELTVEVEPNKSHEFLNQMRTYKSLDFDILIDVCGVDYLQFGVSDWETESATLRGFSRGKEKICEAPQSYWHKPRFAVVYHLLSTTHNHRLRVKVFLEESHILIKSVHDIWPVANWFEREAYDLYGILFENHPDLRRILTDYGFIGYPFRKDFPVSGHVEVRYDATIGRVIYEPVQIEPRINVPRVIRQDSRYVDANGVKHD